MDIGSTLKIIRDSKGLSQNQFCTNILSRSFYSKVENNQSNISSDLLLSLLKNVNVTLGEFEYIQNNYTLNTDFQLIAKIKQTLYNENISELLTIIETLKNSAKQEEQFYLVISSNYIHLLTHEKINHQELEDVRQYLLDIPTWQMYEFKLFLLCAPLFTTQSLLWFTQQLVKSFEKNKNYTGYIQEFIQVLIHLSTALLAENMTDDAYYYLQLARTYSRGNLYMYENLLITLLEKIRLYNKGSIKEKEEITHLLELFHLSGMGAYPLRICNRLLNGS